MNEPGRADSHGDEGLRARRQPGAPGGATERRTLESLARFAAPGSAGDKALKALIQQLPTEDNAEIRLAAYVASTTGTKPAPFAASLTPREKELSAMVPTVTVSIQAYLDKREQLKKPASLHSLMAYEVINFADGANSYLDIYRAVAAEADAAGDWYYGTVSLDDVVSYLDSAKAAGIITVGAPGHRKGDQMSDVVTLHRWDEIALEKVTEMISRKIVTGDREMLAQIYLKKGALVPTHSHESEQMTYVRWRQF
jgi:hypothetical protein